MYERSMQDQVTQLFSAEYGVSQSEFTDTFVSFYEHPFQGRNAIRVVALEGEQVVGFQSFFFWPYRFEGRSMRSFQSGNSLVHPDYRGRGIFQSLLNFIYDQARELDIDFLMGFPVEASHRSFL